jgi:hypothetical protein
MVSLSAHQHVPQYSYLCSTAWNMYPAKFALFTFQTMEQHRCPQTTGSLIDSLKEHCHPYLQQPGSSRFPNHISVEILKWRIQQGPLLHGEVHGYILTVTYILRSLTSKTFQRFPGGRMILTALEIYIKFISSSHDDLIRSLYVRGRHTLTPHLHSHPVSQQFWYYIRTLWWSNSRTGSPHLLHTGSAAPLMTKSYYAVSTWALTKAILWWLILTNAWEQFLTFASI